MQLRVTSRRCLCSVKKAPGPGEGWLPWVTTRGCAHLLQLGCASSEGRGAPSSCPNDPESGPCPLWLLLNNFSVVFLLACLQRALGDKPTVTFALGQTKPLSQLRTVTVFPLLAAKQRVAGDGHGVLWGRVPSPGGVCPLSPRFSRPVPAPALRNLRSRRLLCFLPVSPQHRVLPAPLCNPRGNFT